MCVSATGFTREVLAGLSLNPSLAVSTALAMTAASPVSAGTMLYRYVLDTGTLPGKYVQPLPGVRAPGSYFRVTTDAKGAITSVEELRSGRVLESFRYSDGAGGHPSKVVRRENGEQVGYELLSYYPDGKKKRSESYTSLGKYTGYETCQPISAGVQECADYDPAGKLLGHIQNSYGASGFRTRQKNWHEGDWSYHERTYDPTNGLEIENRLIKFDDGRVLNIAKSAYDADGDPIRRDGYGPDEKSWFGSIEYKDGLATKKTVRMKDGTYEADYHYDAKRLRTGSDVLVNGKPAFRFAYVRQSDGTLIKTQALGLDGQLWAEYVGASVDEVDRNGVYVPNPTLAVIYRKEPWW